MKIVPPKNLCSMRQESGQILAFALILLSIIILMMSALFAYTVSQIVAHRHAVNKEQALNIAEGGVEIALWKLNNQSGYTGETDTVFGNGTFTTSVATINSGQKNITVTGYVPNSTNPVVHRSVKITANIGSEVAFHYGVQTGNGGLSMSGSGTTINGNVYSNGNISGNGIITGSAAAANLPGTIADQVNDTPVSPTDSVTFANASATENFAQSFMLSQSYSFHSIQFYIKKVGSPSNATVRIVYDNNGVPGTTSLMTATLNASQVTTNYGWVTVTMPTSPIPNGGQTYWLIIDASSSSSKYYILGANQNGYASGTGKIGKYGGSWNNTSPAGLDGYFKIYLGGTTSAISDTLIGSTGNDIAWAHTVSGATVSGTIYCQIGSGNNKACNTSRPDPDPEPLPVSDGNIQDWKDEAIATGNIFSGDYTLTSNTSLGPEKIEGDLVVGNKTLTVTGTLWVTGDIRLSGGGMVQLDASYGSHNGVIVSDGSVDLTGGSDFAGSGQAGSYPFLITTSSCPDGPGCSGPAINFSGGSGTVALVAQNGTIAISGGSALKAIVAKTITMTGGSELIYDGGLVNANFTSGPGGSWTFTPGSYVIVQ